MKRIATIALSCLFLLTGCHSFKDVKVTSADLAQITPMGLTAIKAVVEVGIDNPTMAFELKDVQGLLRMNGDSCLVVTSQGVKVDGRCSKSYFIPLEGKLADGFNPFSLLQILSTRDLSIFTIDVRAKGVLRSGIGKVIEYKDIPLDSLIDKL